MKLTDIKQAPKARMSKYCHLLLQHLRTFEHASNADILRKIHETHPRVSATTIHRATARLQARGMIATAPCDASGAMRYDTNTKAHDHFMCDTCGQLTDINIAKRVDAVYKQIARNNHVTHHVTIHGLCANCKGGFQ